MDVKTLEFIKKAKEKHGDRYDYSLTKYLGCNDKVIIICNKHGEFDQLPRCHIDRGNGCKDCAQEALAIKKIQKTKDTFIIRAKEIHGDLYDYSKINIIDQKKHIIIICKKCNIEFPQTPSKHLQGQGCNQCGIDRSAEKQKKYKTIQEFINDAKLIHGEQYDYSESIYINIDELIKIKCKEHNIIFNQSGYEHLKGSGCPDCGIIKASKKKINDKKIVFQERANKVHNNMYDYSKFNYTGSRNKSIIICKKCKEEFPQTANNHLGGDGCPYCKNPTETILYEALKKLFPNIEREFKKEWCKDKNELPYDFMIPELNIIIELDGSQHIKPNDFFGGKKSFKLQKKHDIYKEECANKNNFSIIRLLTDDVKNNKYEWLNELKSNIEKIKKEKKVQNIYMCKNNEYDDFTKIDFNELSDHEEKPQPKKTTKETNKVKEILKQVIEKEELDEHHLKKSKESPKKNKSKSEKMTDI